MYNLFQRFCALVMLVLLSPLFLVVALLIKLESKGPVFFKQERIGKDNVNFTIYKFRSMKVGTPSISTEEFKNSYDFTTKVGKFIRKTSIDELPQLINVLKGDMSLVGPRPSLPKEVENFEGWMLRRLDVKPGLTCYWQVSGRNNIDFEDWMKLDIKYVEERNFWIDIKLIFKTVFVLFGDKNAC